jgi:Asp-tRNA(Asn)/Glu-tRNA(Gln) amidotransferase A subunit family amidase
MRRPPRGLKTTLVALVFLVGACGEGNLPIGVQFVARDEGTALDVAIAFQSATQVHMRAPPWPSPDSGRA